jgi:hypothetical protein
MLWRTLLLVLKSAAMVALFEFLRPVADSVGLRLEFMDSLTRAISNGINVPYGYAELVVPFLLATMLVMISKAVWSLVRM